MVYPNMGMARAIYFWSVFVFFIISVILSLDMARTKQTVRRIKYNTATSTSSSSSSTPSELGKRKHSEDGTKVRALKVPTPDMSSMRARCMSDAMFWEQYCQAEKAFNGFMEDLSHLMPTKGLEDELQRRWEQDNSHGNAHLQRVLLPGSVGPAMFEPRPFEFYPGELCYSASACPLCCRFTQCCMARLRRRTGDCYNTFMGAEFVDLYTRAYVLQRFLTHTAFPDGAQVRHEVLSQHMLGAMRKFVELIKFMAKLCGFPPCEKCNSEISKVIADDFFAKAIPNEDQLYERLLKGDPGDRCEWDDIEQDNDNLESLDLNNALSAIESAVQERDDPAGEAMQAEKRELLHTAYSRVIDAMDPVILLVKDIMRAYCIVMFWERCD